MTRQEQKSSPAPDSSSNHVKHQQARFLWLALLMWLFFTLANEIEKKLFQGVDNLKKID